MANIDDKIKFDNEDSNFTWIGEIVKITEKYFLVNCYGVIERVKKSKVVCYY